MSLRQPLRKGSIGGGVMPSGQFNVMLVSVGSERDRKAFRALFDHFAPRLKSFYFKAGTNPQMAEELVQETFAQIWRKAHLYDPGKAAASTWIFTIARNQRIDRLRSEKSFVLRIRAFLHRSWFSMRNSLETCIEVSSQTA